MSIIIYQHEIILSTLCNEAATLLLLGPTSFKKEEIGIHQNAIAIVRIQANRSKTAERGIINFELRFGAIHAKVVVDGIR